MGASGADQLQINTSARTGASAAITTASDGRLATGRGSRERGGYETNSSFIGADPQFTTYVNLDTGGGTAAGISTGSNDDNVCFPTAHRWFAYVLVSVALLAAGLLCALLWRGLTALNRKLRVGCVRKF